MNKSSNAYSYALLSETGEALFVDYGYDMTTGLPAGQDRAGRRPWLASLPALKQKYGVTRVAVALPTHYHDDHVAGMPLLRDVEGTEIWAPSTVAPIMADPTLEDLPCQWYDPIVADRILPVGESFQWNEYLITVHDQPGHTLYHVAYEVEVDGVRVLFTGDQQENLGIPGKRKEVLNYQYRNRFRIDDYVRSAKLYQEVAPAVMLSGHWTPAWVEDGYLQFLLHAGEDLAELHRDLLPLDELDLGADGVLARLAPYRATARAGAEHLLTATVRNPFDVEADATLELVTPPDWTRADPVRLRLEPHQQLSVQLPVVVGGPSHRARVALEVTIGELRLGQHTDAVVEVI
jgi:glyoxylase-like metal-dependent hydrolase (beta-lactamase superfamily II)